MRALSLPAVMSFLLLSVSWALHAQSSSTDLYLKYESYKGIIEPCKQLFPQKKMIYSARFQSWKVNNEKSIQRGREDMINLATMLRQPVELLVQQKTEGALMQLQNGSAQQQQLQCQELESL